MNAREACERVLGPDLARSIIADMGLHWCVVTAMCECKVSHGPAVKSALAAFGKDEAMQRTPARPD